MLNRKERVGDNGGIGGGARVLRKEKVGATCFFTNHNNVRNNSEMRKSIMKEAQHPIILSRKRIIKLEKRSCKKKQKSGEGSNNLR